MARYLPLVWFLLAGLAVLFIAGLGAAGHWRGALRYVRTWSRHVAALALAGVVLALILRGIMPNP